MAQPNLTVDASSPADVDLTGQGTPSTATTTFSPPGQSLVVIFAGQGWTGSASSASMSISDTSGAKWTLMGPAQNGGTARGGGVTGWWCWFDQAPGSITVTVTYTGWNGASGGGRFINPLVFDGAHWDQSGAAFAAKVVNTAGTDATVQLPVTQGRSWVWGIALDPAQNTTFTAAGSNVLDTTYSGGATDGVTMVIYRLSGLTASAGTFTLGGTWGSASATTVMLAFEVLGSQIVGATPRLIHPGKGVSRRSRHRQAQLATTTSLRPFGRVQTIVAKNTTFASNATTAAFTSTQNNVLLAAAEADTVAANGITVSDNKGNTWSRLVTENVAADHELEIWWAPVGTGGAGHTVSAIDNGGGVNSILIVEEWSGAELVSPSDGTPGHASAVSATPLSGAVTTALAYDLIWSAAVIDSAAALSASDGFTGLTTSSTSSTTLGVSSKVAPNTGSYAGRYSASASASWSAATVAIKASTGARLATDTANPSDSATRTVSFARSAADIASPSDSAARTTGLARAAADTTSPSDSASRTVSFARAAADSTSPSDSATRTVSFARSAADTASPSDVATAPINRSAADTASPSDSATRTASKARSAADIASPSDSATRTVSFARSAVDTAAPADSATRTINFVRSAADTASPSDSATRTASKARSAADTASPSDSATRTVSFARSAADTASPSDSATRTVSFARTAADSSSPSDSAVRTSSLARAAADSSSPSDSAVRTVSFARTAADVASPSDSAVRTDSKARSAADVAGPSDSATRTVSFARAAIDVAAPSDSATASAATLRSAADTASPTDSATRTTSLARAAADVAGPSDSAVRTTNLTRAAVDTASPSDSAVRTASKARAASDVANPADSATRTTSLARAASDTASPSDSAGGTVARPRFAADIATPSDQAVRTTSRTRVAVDIASPSDTAGGVVTQQRGASDTAAPSDVALLIIFSPGVMAWRDRTAPGMRRADRQTSRSAVAIRTGSTATPATRATPSMATVNRKSSTMTGV